MKSPTSAARTELRLAEASRRLRRPAGRPRGTGTGERLGTEVQSAPREPAKKAEKTTDFALTLLPRGLPIRAAASYSGLPVRAVWRLIAEHKLTPVRIPGCRTLILRDALDRLLESYAEAVRSPD